MNEITFYTLCDVEFNAYDTVGGMLSVGGIVLDANRTYTLQHLGYGYFSVRDYCLEDWYILSTDIVMAMNDGKIDLKKDLPAVGIIRGV